MKPVLYAGDNSLTSAAAYLGGVMTYCRIPFDYVPSTRSLIPDHFRTVRKLVILSDFPAGHIIEKDDDEHTSEDLSRYGASYGGRMAIFPRP